MTALARLAEAYGIGLRYHDIWGALHEVSDDTLRALLAAMGVNASNDAEAEAAWCVREQARWGAPLPPLIVLRVGCAPWRIRLRLPEAIAPASLQMRVVTENAVEHLVPVRSMGVDDEALVAGQRWRAYHVALNVDLAPGYHRLELLDRGRPVAQATCTVAPRACYRPPALRNGGRVLGASVQLYGLRSRRNWGIGDFTDLGGIVARFGESGIGIVGVNPLHALFPHDPLHASPYSPSSRLFLNAQYLDVEAIDDFGECAPARDLVASAGFRQRLAALRDAPLVDYAGVAAAKREVLVLLHASFRDLHQARHTERAERFEAFKREGGEALHRHALFDALQAHCFAADPSVWGWPAWPARFRDPRSPDVAAFATVHADEVDFHAWLQWQAELQCADAAARARAARLAVGLYTDLAVSVDRGGAETWAQQDLYAKDTSVGAPPDAFNTGGQDWGLPPIIPSKLADAGFAPFLATLRANMRHAGALRIDHVMGLMRLFWVPAGRSPKEGAYVHYPFDALIALLALESHRHRCLIIGEDLGTVPDEVRRTLAEHDVLSYRVLLFERDASGAFKPPEAYPEAALATASTHDLPTLAGWWEGRDIELRAELGRGASHAERDRQHRERREDRARLLRALHDAGMLPEGSGVDPARWAAMTPALAQSILAFLAATPAALNVVQLEDALLVREQANLPGTTDQHPNWRRKLPARIEDVLVDPQFAALAKRLTHLRRSARARRG